MENQPPVAAFCALDAKYSPDESERPHRLVVRLSGTAITMAFATLKDLQEFIHGAQANLGAALGEAIAHIPPPKEIEALDEAFLEDALCRLEDVQSKVDGLTVGIDMDNLASMVHGYIEGLDADDVELDLDIHGLEGEIRSLQGFLHDREEQLVKERLELEAEEKMREEQRVLAMVAEQAGHAEGDHTSH
jgi:hypothetical protein